ncbi:MAG: hypothetical protein V5A32_02830 [Halovenus sp.]
MQHNRGQAYALEGIIGAVIVVSALLLGLQAVDIAPWTAGDERATEDIRTQMGDTLDGAQDSDALRTVATCLASDDEPHPNVAAAEGVTTEFGDILANTTAESFNYQIYLDYNTSSGIQTVGIDTGSPLPNQPTATVSREVALYDSDIVRENPSCVPRIGADGEPLTLEDESGDIYLEDQDPDSELFAVVRIRVTAW